MNTKNGTKLEYTLKFIEDVKNSDFIKDNNIETLTSRLDEPLTYGEDSEKDILFSFCN